MANDPTPKPMYVGDLMNAIPPAIVHLPVGMIDEITLMPDDPTVSAFIPLVVAGVKNGRLILEFDEGQGYKLP